MITEVSAVALRQNLGDVLNRVQYRRDSILIKKDGKPVAALVDAALFERIRAMQERFDALCERLAKAHEDAPSEKGVSRIERAAALARSQAARSWRESGRLPALPPAAPPEPETGTRRSSAVRAKTSQAKAPPKKRSR